jgi:transcriptional regulator with XRE-family HTH domain
MNKATPAQRIKNIRTALGYTQAEMSACLGMAQNRYSEIEAGKTRVTSWGLVAIAAMEYLLQKRLLKLFLRWKG